MNGMIHMEYITPEEWSHITEDERQMIASAVSKDNVSIPVESIAVKRSFYAKYGKRLLDIIVGGTAFLIALPINLIIGIVTFFDVGRPIFFSQERIGKDGKPFKLTKFRNMTNETNEDGILLPPEQRITKWGSFVRKTSLDELLNLWNVVKGDMSIIGPRPLTRKYYERFNDYHQQRHMIRPGLECPFHDKKCAKLGWQGRFDNDVWYVENVSFSTDIKMFFYLIKKVLSKKERAESASGQTGEFIGYSPDGTVMNEFNIPRKYLCVIDRSEAGLNEHVREEADVS